MAEFLGARSASGAYICFKTTILSSLNKNKVIRIYCLFAFAGLMLWSCQADPKKDNQEPAAPTIAAGAPQYPSVSLDTLQMLWAKCTYIDFVFYNLNFSVSQNESNAVKSTIQHIAADVPVINNACKPEGRIFFQVDGRNALEGDIYLGQNCVYYLWYKDGGKTPYAANSMTQLGVNFFKDLFQKALQAQPQGQ